MSEDSSCSEDFDLHRSLVNDEWMGRHGEPNRHDAGQELDHLDSMTALAVEEIEPIPDLLDGNRVLLGAVLQNQLLEEEEGPFMGHFLAHLHERLPSIFCREFGAVRTLAVLDEVLELEGLLQNRVRQNLYRFT